MADGDVGNDGLRRRHVRPRRAAASKPVNYFDYDEIIDEAPTDRTATPKREKRRRSAASKDVSCDESDEAPTDHTTTPEAGAEAEGKRRRRGPRPRVPPPPGQTIQYVRGRRICSTPGCTKFSIQAGLCQGHGAIVPPKKRCRIDGCSNVSQRGGVCFRHGAPKQKCKAPGCNVSPSNNGLCRKHGAVRKYCKFEGCENFVIQGGLCKRHGAKTKRYLCKAEGCTKTAQKGGLCCTHGTKAKHKKCIIEGCPSFNTRAGLCGRHGAPKRKCSHDGCPNQAVRGGVCISHGAKKAPRLICGSQGCTNAATWKGMCAHHYDEEPVFVDSHDNRKLRMAASSSDRSQIKPSEEQGKEKPLPKKCDVTSPKKESQDQKGGNCFAYGANVRKRKGANSRMYYLCKVDGCTKHAQKGDICCAHGGGKTPKICKVEGCSLQSRQAGVCPRHGAPKNRGTSNKKCSVEGCPRFGQRAGLCRRHGGRWKICDHDGCTNQAVVRGLCFSHDRVNGHRMIEPSSEGSGYQSSEEQEKEIPLEEDRQKSQPIRCARQHSVTIASKRGLSVEHGKSEVVSPETSANDVGVDRSEDDNAALIDRFLSYRCNLDHENRESKVCKKYCSTEQPTREVLRWVRNMSSKKQRRNVAREMRVKVLFEDNIWYGGVIDSVLEGRKQVNIKFDDGTEEVSNFPDCDIIIDDVRNGRHGVDASVFIPPDNSGDNGSLAGGQDSPPDMVVSMASSYCLPAHDSATTSGSNVKEKHPGQVVTYNLCDSEEEEELGAFIYHQSSLNTREGNVKTKS